MTALMSGNVAPFDGVTDPELQRFGSTLEQRMQQRIDAAVQQFQQAIAPVTTAVQTQFATQQEQRGRQMAEALAREFPVFAAPRLGPMYLQQYVQTINAEPWRDRRALAQEIQQEYEALRTQLVSDAIQPVNPNSPTPTATVPPQGPQAPLVRATEPRSTREAGQQLGQVLTSLQQQQQR
jgi:hypothetical protein